MQSMLIDGVGLWCERLTTATCAGGPALFLDRDGVIVEETGYLGRPNDVRLIRSAIPTIRLANELGIAVAVVTNQSGIGRGYYGWHEFEQVQQEIAGALAADRAHVDLVLACAYHGDARGTFMRQDHAWRKPNPGMLLAASAMLDADLEGSLIVGDKITDLQAGRAAGLKTGMLVRTGHGAADASLVDPDALKPMAVTVAADAGEATSWLQRVAAFRERR